MNRWRWKNHGKNTRQRVGITSQNQVEVGNMGITAQAKSDFRLCGVS